jgi:hypothetical protein
MPVRIPRLRRPLHVRIYRCVRLQMLRERRWARDHWWDLQW